MSAKVFFEALGITEAVEIPIYCTVFVAILGAGISRAIVASAGVNLLSYPLFTFLLVPTTQHLVAAGPALWIAEIAVWWCETGVLYTWLRRDLVTIIAVALLANACSFLVGLLVL